MTNWQGANVYPSPTQIDTPHEERPDNVTGTINHFSKKALLLKHVDPKDWQCNGYALLGNPDVIDFWCVIQPVSSNSLPRTISNVGGEHTEGEWELRYNPLHPMHPKEGIELQLSGDESDYGGFADVIEYQGDLWIVRKHQKLEIGHGESDLFIGKAVIELWKPPAHLIENTDSGGHYELS